MVKTITTFIRLNFSRINHLIYLRFHRECSSVDMPLREVVLERRDVLTRHGRTDDVIMMTIMITIIATILPSVAVAVTVTVTAISIATTILILMLRISKM